MFVLTIKDRVVLGPIPWNARRFNDEIIEEVGIDAKLIQSDLSRIPLIINDDIKIRGYKEVHDGINKKIEVLSGPFWEFQDDICVGHFKRANKHIEIAKSELLNYVANERWKKEQAGTTILIKGAPVTLDTDRDKKNNYLHHYMVMADDHVIQWKFREGWTEINKTELRWCIDKIHSHVQEIYRQERELVKQIDNCNTLTELDNLKLE